MKHRQIHIRIPASIHTHYSQTTYGWDTKMNIQLFLKCRPTGRIRGSNPRVYINGLAAKVTRSACNLCFTGHSEGGGSGRVGSDLEVLKSRGSGRVRRFSNLTGRVGSTVFYNPAGRVGSGQEAFKISRVGSGRVGSSQNTSNFSDPTRPVRFDLTREKPRFFYVLL